MNPVFWILVAIVLVGLWFIISPVFNWLGRKIFKKLDKTAEILNKQEQIERKNKEDG